VPTSCQYFQVVNLSNGMQCTHWLRKDWGVGEVLEISQRFRAGHLLRIRWQHAGEETWHKMQELRPPWRVERIVRGRSMPGIRR
jgi:hypothetical protein